MMNEGQGAASPRSCARAPRTDECAYTYVHGREQRASGVDGGVERVEPNCLLGIPLARL